MKTNSLFSSLTAALVVAFAASAAQAAEPYREVLRYAFDQPRDATMAIEAQIRAASPRRLRKIEERLLATLRSSQATTDCKNWVCRQLRFAGSERSVPALEPLLADPKLAAVARLALQGIPGPKADAALRRMLGKTQGLLQAGIIQTIGARASDPSAVPLLVPLVQSKDATVVEEALHALGRLGGAEALEALRRARVPARLEPRRQHALLLCAERLAADGKRAQAAAVYGEIWRQARAEALRIGALRGLLACDLKAGLDAAEAALTGSDRALAQGAAQAVCESANPIAAQALLELWDRLAPETKIAALERFSDPGAIQTVVNATQSPNEAVRVAALRAVARLGGVVDAPMLLQIAVARTGETQKAARWALARLGGEDVNSVLSALAEKGPPGVQAEAIRALRIRGAERAVPILLRVAAAATGETFAEAARALAELGGPEDFPRAVDLLSRRDAAADQDQIVLAAIRILGKFENPDKALPAAEKAAADRDPGVRKAAAKLLGAIGTKKALRALRPLLEDQDSSVREAAARALAEWPDAAAIPELLRLAREGSSQAQKKPALRGLARLAGEAAAKDPGTATAALERALRLDPAPAEKKALLAALAKVDSPRALELALDCVKDPSVELEAAAAVMAIARKVQAKAPQKAAAAVRRLAETASNPAARQMAEEEPSLLRGWVNIAPSGKADSPDGLEKDGGADGDQAAIDGDLSTYWDEADGAKLYRLRVVLPRIETIAGIGIVGYRHHDYAPRDFEILCGGRTVKRVVGAAYRGNRLTIPFEAPERCREVELRITGYYGKSPAVRELEIYKPLGGSSR